MADCESVVYDNEYHDYIIERPELKGFEEWIDCIQDLGQYYQVVYYRYTSNDASLNFRDYAYTSIPKCFGLLDHAALEDSGIIRVRDQPNLSLTGQGVLMGFVDTDFDFTSPLFRNSDGTTRVERIWNQEDRSGRPPEGFLYGTEYSREQINEELMKDNGVRSIPFKNGHGTFIAAVAAGSVDQSNQFSGAAPDCDIAFVQLKKAKQYLKDYYYIPEEAQVYQENDIMAGIHYLNMLAYKLRKPLSLCIALGSNIGNRSGTNPISAGLATVASLRQRCVVVASGNEADKRHHYLGELTGQDASERVEISVSEGVAGFVAELWAIAPEAYEVTILSPTGERFVARPSIPASHIEYNFLFEGTRVEVDYAVQGSSTNNELIFFRFSRPISGIWTLVVNARKFVNGRYHIWLPMSGMLYGEVIFLRSNPDTTLTVPSDTRNSITVAGYNSEDNSIYFESGRGFTVTDMIKPDIAAPAVNVYGPVGNGRYETRSGTSIAAAITAGAGALMLEWSGVRRNYIEATTANIKNYLIRGAVQNDFREYPNREWGWGRLDLYQTFENLRNV